MLVSVPTGYGPGSLSLAYWKATGTVGCELSITLNGKPYGGAPKSGWRLVELAAIDASHCPLLALTGRLEMSVFQTLSAGNTWQLVLGTGAASTATGPASIEPSDDAATTAIPSKVLRIHYE